MRSINLSKYFVLFPLALLTMVSCGNDKSKIEGERVKERTLNFYALNDFHGAFLFDEANKQTGLSKIGNFLINEKNNDPENTFIISSGDMFQGGAESNITKGDIVVEAMNSIGFDSMTIGNHEFDWGEETLKKIAESMEFPLLGINVFYENENSTDEDKLIRPEYLKPSVVIKREGINVGIIGSIMPNIDSSIIATIAGDFYFPSSLDLIEEEAKRLKEEEQCEIVILSTHDGEPNSYEDISEYVDAIFLGHEHEKIEGKYDNGVPYIEGENYGKYLSHISLDLKLNSNNDYEVVDSSYENIDTFAEFNDNSSKIDDIYTKYKDQIEDVRDQVLYTFTDTVSKRRFGNFISKALLDYANSEIDLDITASMGCINNSGGVRDNIPAGEFTYGDLIRAYPFENVFCVLKIDPSDYNLSYFSKTGLYKAFKEEGSLEPIINADGYSYIATIDYVAYQDSYPKIEIIDSDILCRDIVSNYLLEHGFVE